MIVKSIIASFTVTLTSAMQAIHGHELFVFLTLYGLHLWISSYSLRPPIQPSANQIFKQAKLQQWARSQQSTFTSF